MRVGKARCRFWITNTIVIGLGIIVGRPCPLDWITSTDAAALGRTWTDRTE